MLDKVALFIFLLAGKLEEDDREKMWCSILDSVAMPIQVRGAINNLSSFTYLRKVWLINIHIYVCEYPVIILIR